MELGSAKGSEKRGEEEVVSQESKVKQEQSKEDREQHKRRRSSVTPVLTAPTSALWPVPVKLYCGYKPNFCSPSSKLLYKTPSLHTDPCQHPCRYSTTHSANFTSSANSAQSGHAGHSGHSGNFSNSTDAAKSNIDLPCGMLYLLLILLS